MVEPVVAFRAFGCTFPGQEQAALRGIDLEIAPGEFVVVAGPSGAGKTTLAQATNGIVQHVLRAATEGDVLVDGASVMDRRMSDLAGSVGMLFQEPESQFVSLYVRDEIAFGPENLLLPRDEILRRMARVSRRIGIEALADRFVYELSGGQKQKVAVASILAMEPKVLVLDEPTANLDPQSARDMWRLAASLRDDGLAILAIEKYLDQVLALADRLVVLDRGHVRFDGPPRDVVREHGRELLEELGLWLPQAAELETLVNARTGRRATYVPFTATEGREVYAGYRFAAPPAAPPHEDAARGEPLVAMHGVSHRYESGTRALAGIDLAIHADEVVAICGANGSGKTTLVKHFVGLLKPTTGEVDVFGRRTRDLSVGEIARHIGFVFQDPEHQFVKDTVADEIRFSLRVGGVPEEDREAIVAEALRTLDLAGLEDRHPFSLSGGQKRRLSVATATVTRPDVLILDEPTYAQDRRTTIDMMRSILQASGAASADGNGRAPGRPTATILVTHDMRLVADYATRAVVMDAGRIVFDGSPVELFARPELVAATRLEVPPIIELARGLREDGRFDFDVVSLPALAAAMS